MPGPLPDENARRRNKRTIPTTNLPISGRADPPPDVPEWVELRAEGRQWWGWAWSTPQAVGWGVGAGQEVTVARRASLEDDLAALHQIEALDFTDLIDDDVKANQIDFAVRRVASLASGRLQILKEMRELDSKLGLTPHALAALRWKIVADEEPAAAALVSDEVTRRREEREARLASGS